MIPFLIPVSLESHPLILVALGSHPSALSPWDPIPSIRWPWTPCSIALVALGPILVVLTLLQSPHPITLLAPVPLPKALCPLFVPSPRDTPCVPTLLEPCHGPRDRADTGVT